MTDDNNQDNDFFNGSIPEGNEPYELDDPFISEESFESSVEQVMDEDHIPENDRQLYPSPEDNSGYNPLFGNEVFTLNSDLEHPQTNTNSFSDTKVEARENITDRTERNSGLVNKLQLELSIVAGTLAFTTKDLEQLAVGNILTVSGVTPGHATLEFEGRILAQGELVNIDGQLGLQINKLEE